MDGEADARSFSKVDSFCRLRLRLGKEISHKQKIGDQLREAICRICKITHPVSGIEGTTQQVAAAPCMFRPCGNVFETQTIASLITLQPAPFHQVEAELAKFECTFVVAEARSGYDPKPHIRKARRVTIAVLETKIHHAANYECAQVLVEEHCSRKKYPQDL